MMSLVLGLTTGLMLVLPFLTAFGLPLAYVMTLGIFIYGIFFSKKGAPESQRLLIFIWTIIYVMFAGLIFETIDPISITSKNFIFLMAAFNIVKLLTDRKALDLFLVGLGAIALVNSSVAIMQYYDVGGVRLASLLFLQKNDVGEVMEQYVESTGLRVFGLQAASHIFAYTSSLLTAVFLLAFLTISSGARLKYILLTFLSLLLTYSVFLSAQRTAFWPLLIPVGYVFYLFWLRSHYTITRVSFGLMLSVSMIWILSSDVALEETVMGRLFEGLGQTSADSVRSSTWDAAIDIISEDPWFGMAYKFKNLEVGIHNTFLNGWAQLGIVWLALFTFALIVFTIRAIYRKNVPQRVVAVSILAIVFFNMMFHSSVPTLNDLVFYIALAMLLVLQRFARRNHDA